jgi:hypothetical protein
MTRREPAGSNGAYRHPLLLTGGELVGQVVEHGSGGRRATVEGLPKTGPGSTSKSYTT